MLKTVRSVRSILQSDKPLENLTERASGKYLQMAHRFFVLGYTHSFLLSEGVKTRLHLSHFIGALFPEIRLPMDYKISFFDPAGKLIKMVDAQVPFAGFEILDVNQLLAGQGVDYGMIVVHASLSAELRSALVARTAATILGSYFFVTWETDGNFNCSHSIEAFKGEYYDVPWLAQRMFKPSGGQKAEQWTSSKGIVPAGLRGGFILMNNPTFEHRDLSVALLQGERVLMKKPAALGPCGSAMVRIESKDLASLDPKGPVISVRCDLGTGNAKPYLFLKYESGAQHVAFHL